MTKPRKDIIRDSKRVLSWGLGVQSTCLAVMSVLGDIPEFDFIVSADTGWELPETYGVRDYYYKFLTEHGANVSFVSNGNIYADELKAISMPVYCAPTGGLLRRQCTGQYKIEPIRKFIRNYLGHKHARGGRIPKGLIKMNLGISYDEFTRMKDSDVDFITNEFPLVDMKITRDGCIKYFVEHKLPVPTKSACVCCPYSSVSRFLHIKKDYPEEWKKLIEFDKKIRKPPQKMLDRTDRVEELYLNRYLKPIEEIETLVKNDITDICESGYCFV